MGHPLGNKDFLLLWSGQTVSQMGSRIFYIALMWWVLESTGSAFSIGTIMISSTLPMIILSPLAGTFVDRWHRKKVIVWMDIARGTIMFLIAILMKAELLKVWHLYWFICLSSVASTFFNPAISATIPNIVPGKELTRANSLSQLTSNLTNILGPSVGGLLVASFGVPSAVILNGASFVCSAVSKMFIDIPRVERVSMDRRVLEELREGVGFIWERPSLKGIFGTSAVLNFFGAPVSVLLPVMAREILKVGVRGLGFMESSLSVGALLATLFLSVTPEVRNRHKTLVWGIFTIGIMLILTGTVSNFYIILGFFLVLGLAQGVVNILIHVYLQRMVPDEKRGRVFGVLTTICGGLQPLGYGMGGKLADLLTVPVTFVISGTAVALGGISLYRVPVERRPR